MKFQSLLFTMLVAVLSFAQVPTITNVSPKVGVAGSSVTITGTGFTGSSKVLFGNVYVTPSSVTGSTQLTFTVPKTAVYSNVAVRQGSALSNSKFFRITQNTTGSLNISWAGGNYFANTTEKTITIPSSGYANNTEVNTGDFDGDGDADFLIPAGSDVQIMLNDGSGNASQYTISTITTGLTGAIFHLNSTDIDADGDIDFAASTAAGGVKIFFNSGSGTFSSATSVTPASASGHLIELNDYDSDGDIDLALVAKSPSSSKHVQIYTNTSNSFTLNSDVTGPGTSMSSDKRSCSGDIDGDGISEIFYTHYQGGLYMAKKTSGTWAVSLVSNVSGVYSYTGSGDVSLIDYDADGDLDILLHTSANQIFLNSSGSFSSTASYIFNGEGRTLLWDLDADGDLDGFENYHYYPQLALRQFSSGNLAASSEQLANSPAGSNICSAFDLIDVNSDNYPDIVFYQNDKFYVRLFQGNPSPPTITANPSNTAVTYCVGSTATALSITANGATSYKWQSSPNNSTWTDVAGATNASYTPSTASASALYYRGVAINSFGSTNSAATGLITVNALPTLTTNPNTTLSQYCYNYSSTTAITVATSASSPTYQWQVSSDNSTFTNVTTTNGSGGTTASFVPSHVDIWYGGTKYYRCVVTSNGCSTTSNTKPFGVYASLTSVTIPSTANENYCINATPNNLVMQYTGDNNLVYQWSWGSASNGPWNNISGATSTTYTPPTNISNTRYYRCNVSGTCSNTAKVSGAITVTDTYTWTGATSSNTTVAGNWSPAAVPCSGANIIIPANATNFPTYNGLTIANGTTITVQAGATLTEFGVLTNNGTLTIESGATFVQKPTSSLAGTGTYNVKQTVTGAGGATPTGRFWYMGLPINNLTRAAAFGAASGSNRLWSWSESGQVWSSQITDATTLTPTTGYVFRTGATSTTLNFSGTSLYSANASITGLTNSGGTFDGCHLMSNPYTAYLDWEAIVADAGTTNLASTYCVRSFNSTSSEMVYDTYNATGDVSVNPSGVAMTRYIAPMQSFWITVNPSSTGTLSMTKAMLTHQAGAVGLKDITSFPAFARLNLVSGNFYDQVVVYTDVNATAELENYDSKKFFLPNKAQVYCPVGNEKLVINALKQGKAQTSAPLTVELPSTQVYKFEMAESFVENGLVILEDKQEGIFQDMGVNPVYEFFGNSGVIADRFVLHFQLPNGTNNEGQAGIEDLTSGQIAVIANHNGAVTVALSADLTTSGDIQIFDEAGRLVAQKAITSAQTSLQLNNGMGVYFVRVQTPMKTEMKKVMVY